MAGEEQIESNNVNDLFCKSNGIVDLLVCSECGLAYVGQTGSELIQRINSYRSAVKNFSNCDTQDFELLHFQVHPFDECKLFVLLEEMDSGRRLDF